MSDKENKNTEEIDKTTTDTENSHEKMNDTQENSDIGSKNSEENLAENLFDPKPQETPNKGKKLWPYIYLLFLLIALLIIGYIYNIAGLRDRAQYFDFHHIPFLKDAPISSPLATEQKASASLHTPQEHPLEKMDPAMSRLLTGTSEPPIAEKKVTETPQEITYDAKSDKTPPQALQEPTQNIEHPDDDKNHFHMLQLPQEEFQNYRSLYRDLKMAVYHGDVYLDSLMAIKNIFPDLDTPTLEKYALSAFPNKISLTFLALSKLKQAAKIKDQNIQSPHKSNHFYDHIKGFFSHFITITPQEDKSLQDQELIKIEQALKKGHLKKAASYIEQLSDPKMDIFSDILMQIQDYYRLKKELRQIDDRIMDHLYLADDASFEESYE